MRATILAGLSLVLRVQADVGAWGQCGGMNWSGETTCVPGYYCYLQNPWYSQCIPGSNPDPTTSTTSTTSTTTTTTSTTTTSTTQEPTPTETTNPPGDGPWAAAYAKAESALGRLSQNEKIGIVTGIGWENGPCVGNTSPASSINFPQLCLHDGPQGIRFARSVTAFTPGVQAASTWDVDLIRQRGQFIGEEARGVGIHVLLGPAAGALGKLPEAGRNWESFSVDPYLSGIAMAETIEGVQSAGVQATAKHYLLNEQERNRETMTSNPDSRTLQELYLWPFADAVHSNVAAVMCSYNKVNGTWACENEELLDLLKEDLGFPGFVVSDWNAQHSTSLSANAGLDMTMPGTDFEGQNVYWGPQLANAISQGAVPQSRLDDMVTRILASWYLTGQDTSNYPQVNLNANVQQGHSSNVLACARDGLVLLKNDNNILPLSQSANQRIAIIGSGAVMGAHARNQCTDHACNDGALGMGWGSGSVQYPYFSAPYDAINSRAQTTVLSGSDSTSQAANAAQNADIAVVFITADSGEGYLTVENNQGDRNSLDPWHNGNALVAAVAAANPNTIVVVHAPGPVILESVLSNSGVKAILWAGMPGQESGNALAEILFGDVSPSGKLPYTIAQRKSDYPAAVVPGLTDSFNEGLYIDYRHFDAANISPRYEFGFGLSYTSFSYSSLSINVEPSLSSGPATGPIIPGGRADLWDTVATISCVITNDGDIEGSEAAQLYLEFPGQDMPVRQLRGFDKIKDLQPGASGTATFVLRRRDVSFWDGEWVVPSGEFGVVVGASSRDQRLVGSFSV